MADHPRVKTPTLKDVTALKAGDKITLEDGPAKFVRIRNGKAVFISEDGHRRINLMLSALEGYIPPAKDAGARVPAPSEEQDVAAGKDSPHGEVHRQR